MNKILKEHNKKNEKSLHLKQIQNIMNKKRKRIETPSNINSITFSKYNINKLNKNIYQKNTKTSKSTSKSKKRNNSNNDKTKLLLPVESPDYNLIQKHYTLSSKTRTNNYSQKRNINHFNYMKFKTKFKSNSNYHIFSDKDETINYSINSKKYYPNNGIYKKFKIEENFWTPSHRKQNSYNENNFYLKIKKNLIKSNDSKVKGIINKKDFLKNEIQKAKNSKKGNIKINTSVLKNKLVKKSYGNFKKINLKTIDFITKKEKKRPKIDLKNKNLEKNINLNSNRYNLNCNIFNLYKTLNQNKNKEENCVFNNTSDKYINDKNSFRKVNHQKTISYNFISTRNLNNNNPKTNQLKLSNKLKTKSIKRKSQNDMSNIKVGNKKDKNESFLYIKNMFKNNFFDYFYFTKDNINYNINDKNSGEKTLNIKSKKNI